MKNNRKLAIRRRLGAEAHITPTQTDYLSDSPDVSSNIPTHALNDLSYAVRKGDSESVAIALKHMADDPATRAVVPADFLVGMANALTGKEMVTASTMFHQASFFGPKGDFLLVGPYRQRRQGGEIIEMSLLVGKKLSLGEVRDPRPAIQKSFHQSPPHIPRVIAVRVHTGLGNVGTQAGEAFATPDGWILFDHPELGPALNDMDEQERRYGRGGFEALESIFCSETFAVFANFLQDLNRSWRARHKEYSLHDVGHATGLGLEAKLDHDLLKLAANRGREEWRADGIAFLLAPELVESPGDIILSNLAVRFGVDAQRNVGNLIDTDVMAAEMTFVHLIEGGGLEVTRDGLRIVDTSEQGLIEMVSRMTSEARLLTQRELSLSRHGNDPADALGNLYATQTCEITACDKALFDLCVRFPGDVNKAGLR